MTTIGFFVDKRKKHSRKPSTPSMFLKIGQMLDEQKIATNIQVYCMWPAKPLENMYNPVVHFSSGEYGVETTKKKTW